MREPKNDHPYIIACGESHDKITHFYIDLERHLLSVSESGCFLIQVFEKILKRFIFFYFKVPGDYGIAQTFDLFLKVHESIGLNFEPNIKTMAHFCLHFLYDIKKIARPSPRLKSLFDSFRINEP